jgi:polyisoprenyl-teichoic acid--peptidoglycan teichoic acid transferase
MRHTPVRVLLAILRLVPIVMALAIVIPSSGVRPTTLSLTKVETAGGYDVGPDVVWVLVLGEDNVGDTDAIQLLGIDVRTGAAAAIGFPRDTWVDLGGGHYDKINQAYKSGKAALAGSVVRDLVGIAPDFVLVTAGDGFVSMVDALGGVTVDSPLPFVTDDGRLKVTRGPNELTGHEALEFAATRLFPGPGDFTRSKNHQALLLGLLKQLQGKDHKKGFVEMMALSALDGLDTNASPVDLYRLLNALTGVDPSRVEGCVLVGTEDTDSRGNQIIRPDMKLAQRLGREAAGDATFEHGCGPDQP